MMTAAQHPAPPPPAQVLLVDDEALIRALLGDELRSAGLEVVEAASADEAWHFLQTGGHADLVISDISMPGTINGIELARRVRVKSPALPVMLISGNAGPTGLTDITMFLQKPFRIDHAVELALQTIRKEPAA
jgi:CheY-like chemotaxis protein